MAQKAIRVTLPPELYNNVQRLCSKIGAKETEYVKSLIVEDMKQNINNIK
jgi:predicted DNA-binding protein